MDKHGNLNAREKTHVAWGLMSEFAEKLAALSRQNKMIPALKQLGYSDAEIKELCNALTVIGMNYQD